jgi:spermidine/putrescine transport system substrate-binding protein
VLREQRPLIRMYTDDTTSSDTALAAGEIVAIMAWNSSVVTLTGQGVPVKFAKPKEGALTWVCGQMLHKDAPNIDSAYDILDSLISQAASTALIRGSGYGGPNRKSYDEFTDEELANLGLARNPMEILQSGHFGIPQTAEWDQRMTSTWEQIKLGF